MKKISVLVGLLSLVHATAQNNTGINTTNPKTTLDIKARQTDGSAVEGVITPQVTGDALKTMATSMNATHQGNFIYVTAPVTQPNSDPAWVDASSVEKKPASILQIRRDNA